MFLLKGPPGSGSMLGGELPKTAPLGKSKGRSRIQARDPTDGGNPFRHHLSETLVSDDSAVTNKRYGFNHGFQDAISGVRNHQYLPQTATGSLPTVGSENIALCQQILRHIEALPTHFALDPS